MKDQKRAPKATNAERGPAVALARAIWIENTREEITQEQRRKRVAEWKVRPKDEKKSMMSLARKVLKRLDRAGFGVVRKA